MTAVAINETYQNIGKYASKFELPHYGQKSVKAIQYVICFTTDEGSVIASKKLLDEVLKIKENLPIKDEGISIPELQKQFDNTNENLGKLNSFFDSFHNLFKTEGAEIEIDDDNMLTLLSNLKTTQKLLIYISDYLQLALEVQTNKSDDGSFKTYSIDELAELLKAS